MEWTDRKEGGRKVDQLTQSQIDAGELKVAVRVLRKYQEDFQRTTLMTSIPLPYIIESVVAGIESFLNWASGHAKMMENEGENPR